MRPARLRARDTELGLLQSRPDRPVGHRCAIADRMGFDRTFVRADQASAWIVSPAARPAIGVPQHGNLKDRDHRPVGRRGRSCSGSRSSQSN